MNAERGGDDHGRQLMNLHNNEAGRRVCLLVDFARLIFINDGDKMFDV